MFKNNRYTSIYNKIIQRSKGRSLDDLYTEIHHIVPRCMKGSNDKENIAVLTAKEHYVCHHLLTKMVDEKYQGKMWNAFFLMHISSKSNSERFFNARNYERAKLKMAAHKKTLTGNKNPYFNKRHNEKTRQKMKENWNKDAYRRASKTVYEFEHESGEIFRGTRKEFYTAKSIPHKQVHSLVHGQQKTAHGWRVKTDG